jgi:hypothetical protein
MQIHTVCIYREKERPSWHYSSVVFLKWGQGAKILRNPSFGRFSYDVKVYIGSYYRASRCDVLASYSVNKLGPLQGRTDILVSYWLTN